GVRLDDHQRRSPSRPDPREPYPEEPVGRCQPRSLHGPLQDAQLVTECQDLKLQSRAAAEHQDNGREEGGEHAPGRQSMEEPQLVVYQSDRDLREPQVMDRLNLTNSGKDPPEAQAVPFDRTYIGGRLHSSGVSMRRSVPITQFGAIPSAGRWMPRPPRDLSPSNHVVALSQGCNVLEAHVLASSAAKRSCACDSDSSRGIGETQGPHHVVLESASVHDSPPSLTPAPARG